MAKRTDFPGLNADGVDLAAAPRLNFVPVAVDDEFLTRPGIALTVNAPGILANDTDRNGDTLVVTSADITGLQGTLNAYPDGHFTFTPTAGFVGVTSFTYTISDGHGGSDVGTVFISVHNRAPDAVDDSYATRPGQTLAITAPGFLANDTDADGDTVSAISADVTGLQGSLTAFPDGHYTFTPTAGFTGLTSFNYTISDGFGGTDTATVTINVHNAAPDAVNDSYSMRPGQTLAITAPGFLANDTDADGDTVSAISADVTALQGSLTAFPDGHYTFTPTAGFTGLTRFNYTVSDGFGGTDTATVTINVQNAAPDAVNDSYSMRPGQTLSITAPGFLANDTDADGDTVTAISADVTGLQGSLTAFPDGHYTFTPTAGFTGLTSFNYTISDGLGGTDTATVTINVHNTAPDAINDNYIARTGETLAITLPGFLANDSDPDGDPVSAIAADITGLQGSLTAFPDGHFNFTPNAGFLGITTFTYTISDGLGGTDTATVRISVGSLPVDIFGDAAANTLTGTDSVDHISGLGGNDTIIARLGNDQLFGGDGDDRLDGGGGADSLTGGLGNDTYIVDNLADQTTELNGQGTDTVLASISWTLSSATSIEVLTLTGTAGNSATGNGFANTLNGNSGYNALNGGLGADTMAGGAGNDTYTVENAADLVVEGLNAGTDTVKAYLTYTLTSNVENLQLGGSANINATGNTLANTLSGNSGNNLLTGGGGGDRLYGFAGNDTYIVDNATMRVYEVSGGVDTGGTDTVLSSISYTLGLYVEDLTLTGAANINGVGNGLGNHLIGNGGTNYLTGAGGNDTMSGGLGLDVFVFGAGSGVDVITDFSKVDNDKVNVNALSHGVVGGAGIIISQFGTDTVIDLGGGNTVTVTGALAADVTSHMIW